MKKNKSVPRKNNQINRQNLINKISDAMSMKYNNFFTAAKYDTKTLKEDIGKLLTTQYYSKDPRDVFKPIETNILDIVKKKNPQLQVKIKKARKLPEIKYTKDKYQEADELEKEKEEKNLKNNSAVTKKAKMQNQKNNNNIKKETNKPKNNIKEDKKLNNNKDDNKRELTDKDKDNNKNEEINTEEISNTMYKLQEEYGIKHTLVDQLNNRIKYDPDLKMLDEEKKLFEKEQEEKKQKKLLEQQNYLNDLKIQIEERKKKKEQEKLIEQKEFEEIQKVI